MDIHILAPSAAALSAVGRDAREMLHVLRAAGHDARLYTSDLGPPDEPHMGPLSDYPHDSATSGSRVTIFHHAIGWPTGEQAFTLRRRRTLGIVRHHNVTPPAFVERYSPLHAAACAFGITATARLAVRPGLWFWPASAFSARELVAAGAPETRCAVLPPLHLTEQSSATPIDRAPATRARGAGPLLLQVSAFRPHKGQRRAVRVLADYCRRFDPAARLALVGAADDRLGAYRQAILDDADRLGVAAQVTLAESIDDAALRGFYEVADLLLGLSEHEGFGVPFVEAMYHGLPIVAAGFTAVPDVVGDAGLVLDAAATDEQLACAVRDVVQYPRRADALAAAGRRRYHAEFSRDHLDRHLLALLARAVQDAPRGAAVS